MFQIFKRITVLILLFTLVPNVQADLYKIPKIKYPDIKQGKVIEGDILLNKVKLNVPVIGSMELKIYRPVNQKGPRPVIFIAPAGTNMLTGSDFVEADSPEHIPYAKAGYIVVAYSLPGAVTEKMSEEKYNDSVATFFNSRMGIVPALLSIDYTVKKVPNINPQMLVTAGHSSAGAVSLQAAMCSGKITHCISYAPCSSYQSHLGKETVEELSSLDPFIKKCFDELDPLNNTKKLTVPVFLFNAMDDSIIPIKQTYAYTKKLKQTNRKVTLKIVKRGEHYNSMILQGIPQAIKWLKIQEVNEAAKRSLKQK